MVKAKYTVKLLIDYAAEKNITLIGEYDKVNQNTKISGQCLTEECSNTFCKTFRNLVNDGGAFCTKCTQKKAKQQKNENQYKENLEKLITYAQENNVTLYGNYSNINRDTRISGLCTQCNSQTFEKTFRSLFKTGSLCAICTLAKSQKKGKDTYRKRYGKNKVQKIKKLNSNPQEVQKRREETNMKKYGSKSPLGNLQVQEKIKQTNKARTGYDNPWKNPKFQEKMRQNYKIKTGYDNAMQNPEVQETRRQNYRNKTGYDHPSQNPEVLERRRQKYKEKTGYDYPGQNPAVKEKMKLTNLRLYGVEYPMQNFKIQQKAAQKYFEKTGYFNPGQNPESQRERRKTCLERYGVEHPMQNPEISEKASKNAYKVYEYICPSGDIRYFQGFEKFGMKMLLETFPEEDIINLRTEVPELFWKDVDDIIRRHFVDFFMPLENLCVEVKSPWTFKQHKEEVLLKQKYAKEYGFRYEIWIFDKKGKLVKKLE